jgi:hypothetical protein
MKFWQIILLYFLIAIPFIIYVSQEGLWDTDSYFYLLNTCNKTSFLPYNGLTIEPVQQALFSIMPCDIFLIKLILFFICLVCVLIISKIGELFDKDNGWLAGLFCLLFTWIFVFQFFKFENDTFAYPFLFVGLWFLLAGKKDDCLSFKITALLFIGIAGLVWKGAILYLLILGFSFLPALLLSVGIILFVGFGSLAVFLPNPIVKESAAFVIGLKQFLLWVSIPSGAFFWPETLFLLAIGLLNGKFFFLVVPLLAIGAMQFYVKQHKIVKICLLVVGFMLYFGFLWQIITPQLSQSDWKAMQFAIDESVRQGLPLQNDWSLGYQIAWLGGIPGQWGGGWVNTFKPNSIVISQFKQDCIHLFGFENYKYHVWKC